MNDLLDVEDLHVAFRLPSGGTVEALRGVSFRVRACSTVALVGESGAGKSVAGQALLGLLPPAARVTAGRARFTDPEGTSSVDLTGLPRNGAALRRIRGRRISMVFQEPMVSLSPVHTIGDQIGESVRLHRGLPRVAAAEVAAEMLGLTGFASPRKALASYPFELSGGLRQRAMIAMALVCRPALLIADEPTTALDVTIQAQILDLLAELRSVLEMAVLLITHDLGVVASTADEVVVLDAGRVVESGTVQDLFADPRHPYLRRLLRAVPRIGGPRAAAALPQSPAAVPRPGQAPAPQGEPSTPLLEVQDVTKSYRPRRGGAPAARRAVDGVSFAIARGECLGLVGESGCGKTTLAKIIMRAVLPDSGSVVYRPAGEWLRVETLAARELTAYRRQVQLIFQDPYSSLNPRMTAYDIIAEPLVIHRLGNTASRRARVADLMRLVGLPAESLSRYPASFSGGQRQRIGIARALALEPAVLICDEPVSALDVSVQAQVLSLLKALQRQLGLTYLFISHNLAVVDHMADRVAVMFAGRLVEVAPREVLFERPVHPYTQALLAAVPVAEPAQRRARSPTGLAAGEPRWPYPFADEHGPAHSLVSLGGGHLVRAVSVPALEGRGA